MCPEDFENIKQLTGKQCRELLYMRTKRPKRIVPAFTYQTLQSNTEVEPPKKIDLFKKRPVKETLFKIYLRRGDIPVAHSGKIMQKKKGAEPPLKWFCKPQELDYCYYFPIFIDGLSDSDLEIRRLAQYGAMDMILKAPHKILPVLPKVIIPFKRAFNTRDKKIIIGALKVLQLMVLMGPCVGEALVPYYRQLLAVCNLYKNCNVNLGNLVDPDREKRIADVIEDTLNALEHCGGPNAFINIKYMIPTYESCVHPRCEASIAERPPSEGWNSRRP
ncbi:parkin coregulated gene protein homolog isoform X1 [Stomoxys calcitrans]|uniref:parkin coregulated gene protein homolog isoform X1 n=1 Tax=Stomoxys calcitrans TaxID=35570 RepID=UPI0027E217D3|nr:parkin coregulated gene protein homolog isoform X1 [Stomoxys calcitrans]XP_013101007.2 parkin coregulated gene protein homolog isoform X1 [Stomoxys calcitrans]